MTKIISHSYRRVEKCCIARQDDPLSESALLCISRITRHYRNRREVLVKCSLRFLRETQAEAIYLALRGRVQSDELL